MNIQIYEILFVLLIWLYFVFEGLTEAIATKDNSFFSTIENQNIYHVFRVFENLGVIGGVYVLMLLLNIKILFWIFWLSVASGLGLYEMAFSWKKYGNPLYDKTSKWLGIPHPPGWVSIVVFVVFTGIKAIIIF